VQKEIQEEVEKVSGTPETQPEEINGTAEEKKMKEQAVDTDETVDEEEQNIETENSL